MIGRLFGRGFAPLLAVGVLSACAGGGTNPVTSSNLSAPSTASTANTAVTPSEITLDMSKCKSNGKDSQGGNNVSVHPCSVKLSVKNPTANVTTKGPAKGTFSVNDTKCTTNMIATVSGSGNSYVVTAGTANGTCTAKFDDKDQSGKNIGTAKLRIQNNAI